MLDIPKHKEKYRIILILFWSILNCNYSFAQSDMEKAKAYFFQAETQLETGDARKSLEYLEKAEVLLGQETASIWGMRAKAYYTAKDFKKAKNALNSFYVFNTDLPEDFEREMANLIVKIDDGIIKMENERIEKETIYFDENWKETKKANAAFYRPPAQKKKQ